MVSTVGTTIGEHTIMDRRGGKKETPQQMLEQALLAATANGVFQIQIFFPNWFRKNRNSALYFLFKKNLSVTNIQFAELFALIRQHARIDGRRAEGLQFHSADELAETLTRLTEHVKPMPHQRFLRDESQVLKDGKDEKDREAAVKQIAKSYWSIFEKTIVVSPCFGSCGIFMAPHIELDLAKVCGESGYIFSCGRNIFFRNVQKATQTHLSGALDRYFTDQPVPESKLPFIVYSHEEYSKADRSDWQKPHNVEDYLIDGLDELKIRTDKSFMLGRPLGVVVKEVVEEKSKFLKLSSAGVKYHHDPDLRGSKKGSLWLVADHLAELDGIARKGQKRYYVLYEQEYINGNPFHIFDENKPGWVAHTTIPHKLYGAMINITKPWPADEEIVLCDPFVGTGTAMFESLNHEHLLCDGSDIGRLLNTVLCDNVKFFGNSGAAISQMSRSLSFMASAVESTQRELPNGDLAIGYSAAEEALEEVRLLLNELADSEPLATANYEFKDRTLRNKIEAMDAEKRLAFYVGLRAQLRHGNAIQRGAITWKQGFAESANTLAMQMDGLFLWKKRNSTQRDIAGSSRLGLGADQFSGSCSVLDRNLCDSRRQSEFLERFKYRNAAKLRKNSAHLVICDPPYGFNTEENGAKLMELYARVVPRLVEAVKEGGHLIICLPDISFIGKTFPPCTVPALITSQVLAAAEDRGRELYSVLYSLPSPRGFFSPPYYWRSGTALHRKILHFRVRDRQ